jgi:hypothetical protein
VHEHAEFDLDQKRESNRSRELVGRQQGTGWEDGSAHLFTLPILANGVTGLPHHQHELSTKMACLAYTVRHSRFRDRKARYFGDTYGSRLEQRN